MRGNKREMIEVKMDTEISSYQDDNFDPMKDGPLFATGTEGAEAPGV